MRVSTVVVFLMQQCGLFDRLRLDHRGGAHLGLHHIAARGNALRQPHVPADDRPFSNRNAAQDRGPRVDHDVVFHDWMAGVAFDQSIFIFREALGAEGDGLIQPNTLADDRGLADDDSGAVIDEEVSPDVRGRMNVYAGV